MASIVKRGKSYAVVYYENKKQQWESGLSYGAAKTFKAKIELEQSAKEDGDKPPENTKNRTVNEFLYEFIEKYGTKRWGASSFDGNIGLIENYVRPYMGEKKLRAVKTKTVDDYYHYLETEAEPAMNMGKPMRDHITASTIHDIHKLMRCAFNLAVRWEYISKNPFINATLPDHEEKERVVLSSEQVLRVLKFTCRPEHYDYYTMYCAILIALGCTTRGGEIGGLQWDRVDYEKHLLDIDRAIDRVSKKSMERLSKLEILYKFPNLYPGTKTVIVLKQPKTKGSVRTVEAPRIVLDALQALKSMQEKLKIELGPEGYMDYGLVICQANGRPIMTEHLNKRFKDILSEMNDPEIDPAEVVFHSLRHTSASTKLFLSNGDYNSVKHAGGWANLEMLTRRYGAHSFESDREKLAQKMDDFLDGNTGTPTTGIEAEQALKALAQSNPDLLMQIVRSIQSANTD